MHPTTSRRRWYCSWLECNVLGNARYGVTVLRCRQHLWKKRGREFKYSSYSRAICEYKLEVVKIHCDVLFLIVINKQNSTKTKRLYFACNMFLHPNAYNCNALIAAAIES